MEKPDRKLYPDYYDIITDPMDMKTINDKIMTGGYRYLFFMPIGILAEASYFSPVLKILVLECSI